MFEQSVVEGRALAARPWTMAVSLAGQGVLISAAIVMPLVYPETLQRAAFWIPVTGPPRAYRPPAPAKMEMARTVAAVRVFDPHTVFQPSAVPTKIAMLQDEPAPAIGAASGPCQGCVVGGIDLPGPGSAIIDSISRTKPPEIQRAAPPVVKAPPKPPAPEKVRTGGDVQAALLIYGPQPVYPPLARQARISGVVHLAALIGTDGRMVDLRATSGHPLLVRAAIDAVKQWVYRPTMLNSKAVEVVTEITVTFTLN